MERTRHPSLHASSRFSPWPVVLATTGSGGRLDPSPVRRIRLLTSSATAVLVAALWLGAGIAPAAGLPEQLRCLRPTGVIALQRYSKLTAMDADELLMVTAGNAGVGVWERYQDAPPQRIGFWLSPAPAVAVALSQHGWAAAALGSAGLALLDLHDPVHPAPMATPTAAAPARSVAVRDDLLYVGTDGGLEVWDVGVPDRPSRLGSLAAAAPLTDLRQRDDLLYAVGGDAVTVLDLASGPLPEAVGSITVGGAAHLALDADRMLVAGDAVVAFDLADPRSPRRLGSWPATEDLITAGVAGRIAYLPVAAASPVPGFEIWQLPADGEPRDAGLVAMDDAPTAVWRSGDHLVVADGDGRLHLLDMSDPVAPVPIGTEPPPGLVTSLAAADGLAVVGHRGTGLDVLDVAVPAAPRLVARTALAIDAVAVATTGSHAFAAVRGAELVVVDLAQPADPAPAATVALPAEPTSLAIDDGLAVVGLGTDGLAVVDVTEPTTPVVLATAVDIPAVEVGLQGSLAVVTDPVGSLRTVTLESPAKPRQRWRDPYLQTEAFTWRDGRLTAIQSESDHAALQLYAIPDDCVPVVLGTLLPMSGRELADGGGMVVTAGDDLARLVDVSDPTAPVVVAEQPLARGSSDLAWLGGDALLAVGDGVLQSFELGCRAMADLPPRDAE